MFDRSKKKSGSIYFSELSLQQSRSKRILEAMDVMYSEASKQSFASGKIFQKHPNTYLKTDSKPKCQSYFTTYKMDQNVCVIYAAIIISDFQQKYVEEIIHRRSGCIPNILLIKKMKLNLSFSFRIRV